MWPDDPEGRLFINNGRAVELRAEAAANRAGRRVPDPSRFKGLHVRIGSVLILVGRTFGDEAPSARPIDF